MCTHTLIHFRDTPSIVIFQHYIGCNRATKEIFLNARTWLEFLAFYLPNTQGNSRNLSRCNKMFTNPFN